MSDAAPGLTPAETRTLRSLQQELQDPSTGAPDRSIESDMASHRRYYQSLRELLHLFEDVVHRYNEAGKDLGGDGAEELKRLAGKAILALGGEAEPSRTSLKEYDHRTHGPFLGISDEGSAVDVVRRAALTSPKMQVLGRAPPIVAGMAHDAERLAAVGEVAVGPEEYRDVRLGSLGSILTSTNIGTRLNLRYYKLRPTIEVPPGVSLPDAREEAVAQARELLEPFLATPDRRPRPVTLLVRFRPGSTYERRRQVLRWLQDRMTAGEFCHAEHHSLAILAEVGSSTRGVETALRSVDLAAELEIREVALSGPVREEAADKISMPGLLQYFSPLHVRRIMEHARGKGVSVEPKNVVDPDTVARSVWAGLQSARNMGLELGKYGLFPLTIKESKRVVEQVQFWFPSWTAAPAFYVDFPAIGVDRVYDDEGDVTDGVREWLGAVAEAGVPVVLVDTADKDKGRRLLKSSPRDSTGILSKNEIGELDQFASERGVRVLWAGGITLDQVVEFGKLGVFGIYVTSAVTSLKPVGEKQVPDPLVTAVKEPTAEGVSTCKLLLEAGFLIARLEEHGGGDRAGQIARGADDFLVVANIQQPDRRHRKRKEQLARLAEEGWKVHYGKAGWSAR